MKLKANEYIYSINNLTYNEIKSIEYAYGQHIHNAVSGDFACTNDILDQLRARIEKKPIKETSSDDDSITIPKPKFEVGEWVQVVDNKKWKARIVSVYYDYDTKRWFYKDSFNTKYSGNELELIERKENG